MITVEKLMTFPTIVFVKHLCSCFKQSQDNIKYNNLLLVFSRSVLSDSFAALWIVGAQMGSSVRGIFPGKNTGVGCPALFQGIFPTEGSNPRLLRWQVDSLPLSHQGSPSFQIILNQISVGWLNVHIAIRRFENQRRFCTSTMQAFSLQDNERKAFM